MSIASTISLKRWKVTSHAGIACGMAAGTVVAAGFLLLGFHWATLDTGPVVDIASHAGHPSRHHSEQAAARPSVTVLSSEYLPHLPGKKITTVQLDFPPGAFVPKHHHGGSVSVYVVSGSIRSQLAGGPIGTFKTGEMFFEPPGITHVFAENASATEPARVLAIFVHDDGAALTTYHD